jgi:capsular polysaccharide biosynthesis protein
MSGRVGLPSEAGRLSWLPTRPLERLATQVRLLVRWLRWQRRRIAGEAAGGEPARGFRFTPRWCARRSRSPFRRASSEQAWCRTVHPPLPAARGRVHALDRETAAAVELAGRAELPLTFVARIPRGRIVGNWGDVITPDGYWLPDVSLTDRRYLHRRQTFVERRISPHLTPLDGTALVLAGRYAWGNYSHWMLHSLPRLELCRLAGVDIEAVDHFVVNPNPGRYWAESLERLGVPMERLIECGGAFHARADAVLVTSNLRYGGLFAWVHRFLRETFLPAERPATGPKRIFISRGETYWRPLVNERECFALLERHGFVEVRLGEMSIAEQAALFAGARCVATPHDAGLTNLVFSEPGTKVIELFAPQHRVVVYSQLCAARELDYYCLFGEAEPGVDARNPYRVSVDSLARLVELAGL